MMKIYHDYRFTGTPPFQPMFQMYLPLYNASVYWYSKECLFSARMLKTAITVPIRLLVLLPSGANLSFMVFPPLLMASLTSSICRRYSSTSLTLRREPSPFLAFYLKNEIIIFFKIRIWQSLFRALLFTELTMVTTIHEKIW